MDEHAVWYGTIDWHDHSLLARLCCEWFDQYKRIAGPTRYTKTYDEWPKILARPNNFVRAFLSLLWNIYFFLFLKMKPIFRGLKWGHAEQSRAARPGLAWAPPIDLLVSSNQLHARSASQAKDQEEELWISQIFGQDGLLIDSWMAARPPPPPSPPWESWEISS